MEQGAIQMKSIVMTLSLALVWGCGSPNDQPVVETKQVRPVEKILDETHKFPKDGLVESKLVESHLAGKEFMPGGNFAEYDAKGKKYQMFFTLRGTGDEALFLLMDYKDLLEDSKFIAHLGGYFGSHEGVPTLVFQKNMYLIGVTGLDEKDADMAARAIAARLN